VRPPLRGRIGPDLCGTSENFYSTHPVNKGKKKGRGC
jgi:hypothetical protein